MSLSRYAAPVFALFLAGCDNPAYLAQQKVPELYKQETSITRLTGISHGTKESPYLIKSEGVWKQVYFDENGNLVSSEGRLNQKDLGLAVQTVETVQRNNIRGINQSK